MYNIFKNNREGRNMKRNVTKLFSLTEKDFPDIVENISKEKTINIKREMEMEKGSVNFANAIKKEIVQENELLKPGWVSIHFNQLTKQIEYTPPLPQQTEIIEHPNIIMNNIINKLNENRQKYKNYFDDLHGMGAYQEYYNTEDYIENNEDILFIEEEEEGEEE
jgi:hypothetical protein